MMVCKAKALFNDIVILLKTVKLIFKKDGAH